MGLRSNGRWKPLTNGKKRSRAQATGSHMVGTGSDVTGSGLNRKSRVLGWETAEQYEKRIVGSG